MGFRFRRSIKVPPGIRVNIGKLGVSTSIGGRGAHITVGHRKVRKIVGITSSGLSYTHTESTHTEPSNTVPASKPSGARGVVWLVLLLALLIWFLINQH